jgi:hypothetical protein
MIVRAVTGRARVAASAVMLASIGGYASTAGAFTVNITAANPRVIYLQVGVGSFNGIYNSGGTPASNPTVNVVSVTVPAAQVGSGTSSAAHPPSCTWAASTAARQTPGRRR